MTDTKTLLLLGGMTPDVTTLYYNTINSVVRSKLGGRHGAKVYMYSADLEEMLGYVASGDWESFAGVYRGAVLALTSGPKPKVDAVVICAILAHKVARQLEDTLAPLGLKLLHIADALATYLKRDHASVKRLGVLGPKVTMLGRDDKDFFIGRLCSEQNGYEVIVPGTPEEIDEVNRGMLEEVTKGRSAVTDSTRDMFIAQARGLVERGAEAIILGSTDLGFVIQQEDLPGHVPVIEPAVVHATMASGWACAD